MPNSLNVSITSSRYLLALLVSIAALACLCVWQNALPADLKLPMTICVVAMSGLVLRQHYFFRARNSVYALRCRDKQWYLQLHNGEVAATLLPTSTLTNALLVLNFRVDNNGKELSVILLPDSTARDSLRKLKSMLRFTNANPCRNNLSA